MRPFRIERATDAQRAVVRNALMRVDEKRAQSVYGSSEARHPGKYIQMRTVAAGHCYSSVKMPEAVTFY